jgi:hypothetical protein
VVSLIRKILPAIYVLANLALSVQLSITFFFVGAMMFSQANLISSFSTFLGAVVAVIWMLTPLFFIAGIILAFVFKRRGSNIKAFFSLLLPYAPMALGWFIVITAMILKNI